MNCLNKKRKYFIIFLCILLIVLSSLTVGASTEEQLDKTISVSVSDVISQTETIDTQSRYPIGSNSTPFPTDIQLTQQGERNYLHKTYTVAADYDINQLVEEPFEQAGFRYTFSEIIQREHISGSTSKTVSEEVLLDNASGDKEVILKEYGSTIPYSDGEGYKGELSLQENSLSISEKGRESYSYTVSEYKQYPGLTSNDTSSIPKQITKNEIALSLGNISWEVTDSEHYGYSDIPTSYTATAYYSAPATGSKVSSYTSVVSYSGEVTKETTGKSIYTIVYLGEKVIIPINSKPFIIAGFALFIGVVVLIIISKLRKNITIYTIQDGVPVLYEKQRINPKNPVLYLNHIGNTGTRLVFDKSYLKKSLDQTIFIIGKRENYRFELDSRLIYDLEPSAHDDVDEIEDKSKKELSATEERGMSLSDE